MKHRGTGASPLGPAASVCCLGLALLGSRHRAVLANGSCIDACAAATLARCTVWSQPVQRAFREPGRPAVQLPCMRPTLCCCALAATEF